MMLVVMLVAAALLASLPVALRRAGSKLGAGEWAVLCLVALVGAALLVEAALVVWAAPVVFTAVGLDELAAACTEMLGPLAAGSQWTGTAAGVMALVLLAVTVRQWRSVGRRAEALWIEPELGRHERRDGFELVVLPSERPVAYCVTRPSPQVVVSAGLVHSLQPDQFAAIVAHERAHLEQRHGAMLRLVGSASAALRWWPPARQSHETLRAAIERWADDAATRGDRDGRRALRAALLGVALLEPPQAVPALSPAAATAERADALEGRQQPARLTRLGVYLPGALIGATVAATVISCLTVITSSLHALRECCVI